jgi:D-alanyl-D-alanine carboxypeptidase-like protein
VKALGAWAALVAVFGVLAAACGGSREAHTATVTITTAASTTPPTPTSGGAAPGPTRSAPHPHPVSPRYRFSAVALTPALRVELRRTSWDPGCPVGLGGLRYLRIAYWGFDHKPHLGEMIANASAVSALHRAFAWLFAQHFPIRRMRLVDRYGGSDYASIQADNTSAFNCRNATGSSRWSEHAYGLAVDVDPIENPYVDTDGTTAHPASRPYLNRHRVRPGMAVSGGKLVRAFDAVGWGWGGRWPLPTDFQHFSVNGR